MTVDNRKQTLWIGGLTLAVAVGVLCWFSYPSWQRWQTENNLHAQVRNTASNTKLGIAAMGQRLNAAWSQRLEPIGVRLSGVESAQEAERGRLVKVQGEVAGLRRELRHEMAGLQNEPPPQMTDRQRTDLEASTDQSRPLAPGILLTVERTDVSGQRLSGSIRLLAEGRTLRFTDQKIQQPLIFYTQQSERPFELVLTKIAGGGVSGYLLVTRSENPAADSPDSSPEY